MGSFAKQSYDPHLLYHAINMTIDLGYKVPMQKVYNIIEILCKERYTADDLYDKSKEIVALLKKLGTSLEDSVMTDSLCDGDTLQSKIKELLRLLGCELSDQELNRILRGELSVDEALSKQAKTAWLMIFYKDNNGKYKPNKEMVEHMLYCTQAWALEDLEMKIERARMEPNEYQRAQRGKEIFMTSKYQYLEQERTDPVMLERKRNKLRLYIAHLQGYDRDLDRDGGLGIDLTTGIIVDFGDIYMADKMHGGIIDDIEKDGIDMEDIR